LQPEASPTRGGVRGFEVEDLEEAQRHLKVHGVAIVCGPRPRRNDGEQLYVRDPDGYVIELFARREKEEV
jgi:catechol 2,3-dioxygenase-like lactoylglutathione lyase family enzyme